MGVPGQSLALQTARRVGVAPEIVDEALKHLSPESRRYQAQLNEVEGMKAELRELKEELDRETREMKQQKSKFHALISKFESEKDKMLEQSLERAQKKIDQMIEHGKVEDVFRRHERLEQIKFQLPEIVKSTARPAASAPKIDSAEEFAKSFPPGSKVFAPSIGKDAVVQGEPNSRGEVPILAGPMRLAIAWDQLKPPQSAPNPTFGAARKSAGVISTLRSEDRTIDLRGMSVEEALGRIETQLDTAMLNDESRVKIIHGHGTEALKRAVRGYLSRSQYVKKWNASTSDGGGDGTTWAELKD